MSRIKKNTANRNMRTLATIPMINEGLVGLM